MGSLVIQNGKIVELDDNGQAVGAPPQPGRKNRAPGTPRKSVQQQSDERAARMRHADRGILSRVVGLVNKDAGDYLAAQGRRFENGITLGTSERLRAVGQAASGKETYAQARASQKRQNTGDKDTTGLLGDVNEFAGSMLVPVERAVSGAWNGGKALLGIKSAAKPATKAVTTRLGRVAQYAVPAAKAGASSGAVMGALGSDDYRDIGQVARNSFNGAWTGAAGGAALGVAAPFVSRVARRGSRQVDSAISRKFGTGERAKRNAQAAAREVRDDAENEVLGLLQKQRVTPKAADDAMEKMRAEGADPILADVSAATGMRVKTLNDNPNVTGSQRVHEELGKRVDERGGRVRQKLGEITGWGARAEARERQAAIRKARLDAGKEQYAVGGALDEQIHVSDELHDLLNGRNATTTIPGVASAQGANADISYMPSDVMRRHAKSAIDTINANLDFPGAVRKVPNPKFGQPGELEETVVPTVRVMDQMLRSMREEVNSLYRAGKTQAATAIKSQMRALKQELSSANPDYADILKFQSQELARETAHDLAKPLASKLTSNPREVMHALGKIDDPDVLEEVRYSLVSHLIDRSAADPGLVTKLNRALRSRNQPETAAMWDKVLGGPEKVKAFKEFLRAEHRTLMTDAKVVGSQSITSAAKADASAADDMAAVDNLLAAGRAGVNAAAAQPAGAAANIGMIVKNLAGRVTGDADAVRKARQLRLLLKRTERGEMSRIALRNEATQAKNTARRTREGRRAGRAAGIIGAGFTSPDSGE